jgi:CheY-like chemotaxis protein
MPEQEGFEGQGELEQDLKAIWVIDDNQQLANSFDRIIRLQNISGLDIRYYQEASKALDDFDRFAVNNGQLPSIILLDYTLDEKVKNPTYRTGVNFLRALKELVQKREVKLPEIIGFSSSDSSNEELIAAGANSAVNKSDYKAIKNFLNNLEV